MPIRFRCLTCHKSLASASCLAGKRINCPVCKTVLMVPTEEPEAADPPVAVGAVPGPVTNSLAEGPSRSLLKNLAWAGGFLVLLASISAALAMALREPAMADSPLNSLVRDADSGAPAQPDLLEDLDEPSELITPPWGNGSSGRIEANDADDFDALNSMARSASTEWNQDGASKMSTPVVAEAKPADPKAAADPKAPGKIVAVSPSQRTALSVRERWESKRRSRLTDGELRQQLLLPPAVDLESSPGTTKWLINRSPKAIGSGVDLIPQLSATRPDFVGLPLQTGSLARMSTEEALNLKVLSGKLRLIIQQSIPGALEEIVDARPDHEALRRLLLNNPQTGLWLRPQAISTLRQLLIAEHKNVRLILVDLLSNIEGRISSMILAERAIFDLDPDVRLAALLALNNRPEFEYQSALVAGLKYPWRAAADHAAEALVALNLKDAVPKVAMLLDTQDSSEPYAVSTGRSRRAVVPELVRINHLRNCLLCHSYSSSPGDPVRGLVPHAEHRVPLPVAGTQTESKGWGGGGSRSISVVTSTFVRADVTFLRQDFSVVQPVPKHGRLWPADQRFDYLVRLRPLSPGDLIAWQNRVGAFATPGSHSEPVLFALRELTGDTTPETSADWKRLYSTITGVRFNTPLDPANEVKYLKDCLLQAAPKQQAERIYRFREKTGPVYDTALAQAIPDLSAELQKSARAVLADRAFCQPIQTVADRLKDTDIEMRRANVTVVKQRKLKSLTPELIEMLDDANTEIAGQVHQVLQQFAAKDFGPRRGADKDARQEAMASWRDWWDKQTERVAARRGESD
jgi:phage FluMu protein Com